MIFCYVGDVVQVKGLGLVVVRAIRDQGAYEVQVVGSDQRWLVDADLMWDSHLVQSARESGPPVTGGCQ